MPVITETIREKNTKIIRQTLETIKAAIQGITSNQLIITREERPSGSSLRCVLYAIFWEVREVIPYKTSLWGITLKSGKRYKTLFSLQEEFGVPGLSAKYAPRLTVIKEAIAKELERLIISLYSKLNYLDLLLQPEVSL